MGLTEIQGGKTEIGWKSEDMMDLMCEKRADFIIVQCFW